ncbi:mitochondrial substrate carrier family protein [Striga asiatica]|uniref:Mitochondrial substrate carrier family protein n=1 Tax=Striga asiatica TaxID=4170 RepID=A0A5A7QWT2_STRAF|nr:mitochondrial substrate carrier family protein [Striga asiatica]
MDVWPEFLRSSWGREFVAGSIGGTAGVLTERYCFPILRYFVESIRHEHHNRRTTVVQRSCAGIGAGAIQSFVITPIELIKIRLQLQRKTESNINHSGPLDVTRNILKTQGWRGMYRGLGITLLRDAPSHGVYFWTYEFAREQIHRGCRKNGQESFATMLFAGGLAGVTSWISCYPFDVLKTRIQAQSKYCGVFDSFKRCVEQDGYCVLWRGIWMTLSRAFIVNGAVFMAYEGAMRFISNNNDDNSRIQSGDTLSVSGKN